MIKFVFRYRVVGFFDEVYIVGECFLGFRFEDFRLVAGSCFWCIRLSVGFSFGIDVVETFVYCCFSCGEYIFVFKD